jgi:PPP family 3-phenylpropionic acid transporter
MRSKAEASAEELDAAIRALPATVLRMLVARLGLLYGTYFWVIGLLAPYWQKWLDARGLSKAEIGFVAALMIWVKVAANPIVTGQAERIGRRRRFLLVLTLLSLASFQVYGWTYSVIAISIVTVIFQWTLSPLVPLMESMTVDHMRRSGLDYGRVRTFGSSAFLIAALFGGWLLEREDPDILLPLISAGLILVALSAFAVPPVLKASADTRPARPVRETLRLPGFWMFLAASGLVQASHGAFYNFSTLHWTGHGISETTVGLLWGLGVGVEIAFFLFSARLVRHMDPWKLLLLGAIAGTFRWSATALSTELWVLLPCQVLHVFTFAFTHLGAMRYIEKWVPEELTAAANGLYSGVAFGMLLGISTLVSGQLYDLLIGLTFLPMAGMCFLAGFCALDLRRRARRT